MHKLKLNYKFWLEHDSRPLIGSGRYRLLKLINETGSLKKSAESLGISYKTAYNYIKRIESRLGRKVVVSYKGGRYGGGYTRLNETGLMLLSRFNNAIETMERIK